MFALGDVQEEFEHDDPVVDEVMLEPVDGAIAARDEIRAAQRVRQALPLEDTRMHARDDDLLVVRAVMTAIVPRVGSAFTARQR